MTSKTAADLTTGTFVTRVRRTARGTFRDRVMVTSLLPHKWGHTPEGVWVGAAHVKSINWVPLTATEIRVSRTVTLIID